MQMRIGVGIVLLVILPMSLSAHEPNSFSARAFRGARLVYEPDIAQYSAVNYSGNQAPWSRNFPINVDAVVPGHDTVFGLTRESGCESSPEMYAPSDCGSQELIVFVARGDVSADQREQKQVAKLETGAMFVGSKEAPGRSGCLGFPSESTVEVIDSENEMLTVKVIATFKLVQLFKFPNPCGVRKISGEFRFNVQNLDDMPDGGLRHVFEGE